jgi:hypothetical protein
VLGGLRPLVVASDGRVRLWEALGQPECMLGPLLIAGKPRASPLQCLAARSHPLTWDTKPVSVCDVQTLQRMRPAGLAGSPAGGPEKEGAYGCGSQAHALCRTGYP